MVRLVAVALIAAVAATPAVAQPAPAPRPPANVQPQQPTAPLSLNPIAQAPSPVVPPRRGAPPAKGTVTALDSAARETVQKINVAFNAMTMAQGDFVQVAPDGSRSQGYFYMLKPGKVRFNYAPPVPIEFISDGGSIAVRDRKLATQDITPLSQTPLRFLLADRIDLLKDAPLVSVNRDELFVTVVLEERHPLAGTHRLMLMFGAQDYQLKQWTVTDPQGYDTTVAIYNVDTSKRPGSELFKINYERMIEERR